MGAKTDVVVKLVLVFFISLLSFSIGTFVGKKYSDNQHKLAALESGKADQGSRDVASASHSTGHETSTAASTEHGAAPKTGEGMTDEEIAKLAEEFVADDSTAVSSHSTEIEDPSAASPKPRTLDKAEPLGPAKAIAHEKPAAAPQDNRVPSSIPKDVGQYSAGKFTVQVGAYSKEEEAQKVAGDLKSKGFSAFYIPAKVKGQTWYRVSVGLFATPREAQDYRTELMGKAKLSSALVQKIIQ